MKHLIDPTDLTKQEIDEIISLAQDIIAHRERYQGSMSHKKLATLFYEPSTRTRLSFTSAMMELGGNVLGFSDARSSSVSKGESVQDTVRVVGCFADVIAMHHHIEGAQLYATEVSTVPIINAGDGSHSHPTQTLTDLLTIQRELGHIDGITIGFCGDLRFGRTVHSLIKALSRYQGIKVILIAPDELKLPDYIKQDVCERTGIPYREVTTMEEVMGELDVLYMTRVQKERFLDEDEFDRVKDSFVLDAARMSLAKKKMAVLHPLPRVGRNAGGGPGTPLPEQEVHLQQRACPAQVPPNGKRCPALLVLRFEGPVKEQFLQNGFRSFDYNRDICISKY